MISVQPQLLQYALAPGDVVYTPDWCARDMVEWFKPTGRILEPCAGDGAFLKYLPGAEWCEIENGRDFFAWHEPVDWIITNPPYDFVKEFLIHSFELSQNVVFLVPLHNFFRSASFMKTCRAFGWIKHIRTYGNGGKLGFPMGNPIGALYFSRSYIGDTSWSWCGDA